MRQTYLNREHKEKDEHKGKDIEMSEVNEGDRKIDKKDKEGSLNDHAIKRDREDMPDK